MGLKCLQGAGVTAEDSQEAAGRGDGDLGTQSAHTATEALGVYEGTQGETGSASCWHPGKDQHPTDAYRTNSQDKHGGGEWSCREQRSKEGESQGSSASWG